MRNKQQGQAQIVFKCLQQVEYLSLDGDIQRGDWFIGYDQAWAERESARQANLAFALIPGTSRSGATIIGGMLFGLSRKAATEFSFHLAVPTLVAAGAYSLWKERALLSPSVVPTFGVGFVVSFVSALLCIRWLIRYVSRHDFVPFAWYRIAFGAVILLTAWSGLVRWDG